MFHTVIIITGNGDNSEAAVGGSYPAPPGVNGQKILVWTISFTPDKVEVFYLGWLALTSLPSRLRYDGCIVLTLFNPILPVGVGGGGKGGEGG